MWGERERERMVHPALGKKVSQPVLMEHYLPKRKGMEELEDMGIVHPALRGERMAGKGKGKAVAPPYPMEEDEEDGRMVAMI